MSISVVDNHSASTRRSCRAGGTNPELYFAESPSDVELAKALCQDCPVRAECLAGALERREPWGVWGGELFLSRSGDPPQAPARTAPQGRRPAA